MNNKLNFEHPKPIAPVNSVQNVRISNVINPRVFSGNQSECVEEWLERFVTIAKANGWDSDAEVMKHIAAYLDSTALYWYNDCVKNSGIDKNTTFDDFAALIKSVFAPLNSNAVNYDKLMKRQMQIGENLEKYFFDKLRLCNLYDEKMNELNKINVIMRGLTPSLVERVYLMEQKTTEELLKNLRLINEGVTFANSREDWNQSAKLQIAAIAPQESEHRRFDNRNNYQQQRNFNRESRRDYQPRNQYNSNQFRNSSRGRGRFQSNQSYRSKSREDSRRQIDKKNLKCFNCGSFGHFARECYSRQPQKQVRFSENMS
ncbi:hypothetical protein B4U80_12952 [Leptotrombidium deliense]|uniref:CCHC-type domain-containing protein n=1 Tax=Leptotrombidium deliense TaxID=299467 RepID=A0A443SGJ9_9ACAR|nr:hypothetical protein B4U80_12952 [Leptotrombidium deliense]